MEALVCGRVGMGGRAQQGQPHHAIVDVIAVLAVVEQRDTIAGVAKVGPALGAHLEHRAGATVIEVRRPLDMAELDLVRRLASGDGHRESDLQHLVPLVPVHLRVEPQHAPGE